MTTTTALSKCPACLAVVNRIWPSCPACSAPLQGNEGVTIEPAHPNPRPVFWEKADGSIVGPGRPEFLARDGDSFWVVVQFEGQAIWVNSDRLRSRQQFEMQPPVTVVTFVKDPR